MSMDRTITALCLMLTIAAGGLALTAAQRVEAMQKQLEAQDAPQAAAPAEMHDEQPEPEFGFGERMNSLARRFSGLWFAAKAGNTELAEYELHEMEEVIESLRALNKVENGVNISGVLQAMENTQLKALDEAVESGDFAQFEAAYRETMKACNSCHTSSAHAFIHIRVPLEQPVANRVYETVKDSSE